MLRAPGAGEGRRRGAEPRPGRRSAPGPGLRHARGREGVAHRLRHLGLRRRSRTGPVPRQEGLRPADPERGRLRVGHRHGRRAVQGRALDRRHRRRHVRLHQHPGGPAAARPDRAGQRIDISMLESLAEWTSYPLYYAFDGAPPPPRTGASHATIYPYGPFPAGDGSVMLGLQNEREWVNFCDKVLRQPELARDPRFAGNAKRVAERGRGAADHRRCLRRTHHGPGGRAARRRADRQRPGQHHARGLGAPATRGPRALARGRLACRHAARDAAARHLERRPAHGPRAGARRAHRRHPGRAGLRRGRHRRAARSRRGQGDQDVRSVADPRTYLFVPGNRAERFAKALASGADAIVLDLEDAVAAEDKAAARDAMAAWLAAAPATDRARVVVRINDAASPWFEDDLAVLRAAGAGQVMLPKAESAAQVARVRAGHAACPRAGADRKRAGRRPR